ncbi:MAG: hypothetical protein D3X82_08040 [Candidatus Leucobacter sulfamidivorax]|nr:hypothetical protein [Candidatus Leucobacter sulfamidivorax]
MGLRESDEFAAFVAECQKLGLADVKALEAAWEEAASFLPPNADAVVFREQMIKMLTAGVEYTRLQAQLEEEQGRAQP